MKKMVLLTGISGFLGGHVALQLLEKGYRVRGSVRDIRKSGKVRQTLQNHGAEVDALEFIALDLLSDTGWAEAVKGVDFLVHTASPFVTSMPKDAMELITPAVEGTRRALEAALDADVSRMIVTSSAVAIMHGHKKPRSAPLNEQDWTDENSPGLNAYVQSKTMAEKKAWEIMEKVGRRKDLATINPSLILGPLLDDDPGTSGALVLRLLKGTIPAAPRFNLSIIDVRDVAAAHIAAMENPQAGGKRFAMAAGNMWIMQIANGIKRDFPRFASKMPKFTMPDWAIRIYALFDRDIRDSLNELGIVHKIDASRARQLLATDFISAEQAITATVQSMLKQELV